MLTQDATLPEIALVLGTGWGDVLELVQPRSVPFGALPGFHELPTLEGHRREVVYGSLQGVPVIALRGRIHLNEAPNDPKLPEQVRL